MNTQVVLLGGPADLTRMVEREKRNEILVPYFIGDIGPVLPPETKIAQYRITGQLIYSDTFVYEYVGDR